MHKKKSLIIIISVFLLAVVTLWLAGYNIKYLYAGIVYDNEGITGSKLIFSSKSGFYEEDLTLSIYAPTNEIYYTLDGSNPTKESSKYCGPILVDDASKKTNTYSMRTDISAEFLAEEYGQEKEISTPKYLIDKCTVVKAMYYDKDGKPSKVEERVYFIDYEEKSGYESTNIISITTDPENLFDKESGIYVLGNTFEQFRVTENLADSNWYRWDANYLKRGREWEREGYIQVFDTDRKLVLSQSIGLRTQGGISRAFLPRSLNIYARDEYGSNELLYDFFGTGYYPQRVTLSVGGNDSNTKMRDRLGAELLSDCAFATMHYKPYVLFLNGEYWGFYYLAEKYDEEYFEHYYGIDEENVVIIKNGKLEVGEAADLQQYQEMMEFLENAYMTDEQNYQKACELLDMQSFIDYFAAQIYMARCVDWPSSNYALWRSRNVSEKTYEDGKWRWMLFDVNTAALDKKFAERDTIQYVKDESVIFNNFCNNIVFRERFSKRLLEIADMLFEPEHVQQKITEYVELMEDPMVNHFRRFGNKPMDDFYTHVQRIRDFINLRKEYIVRFCKNHFGVAN